MRKLLLLLALASSSLFAQVTTTSSVTGVSGSNIVGTGIIATTNGTTTTLPTTSSTLARTDAANTFTGLQTMNNGVAITGGLTTTAGIVATNTTITAGTFFVTGNAVSGQGGNIRFNDDTGTLRWLNGILGSAGATDYVIRDVVNSANRLTINSATGNISVGTLNATTTLQVNGTSIFPTLSGTTGSIGGGALGAGACTSGTVAVTNSTTAMAVSASPVTYPGDGAYWMAYVSSAGTVTVKVCVAVVLTPTASTYNVRVLQ